MQNNRKVGQSNEELACSYLKKHGYHIITKNYRCKFGEIDIVASKNNYLIFVEVKYRKTVKVGYPIEAVTLKKQRVISKCANMYLLQNSAYQEDIRFDVIGILSDEITHIKNAFTYIR